MSSKTIEAEWFHLEEKTIHHQIELVHKKMSVLYNVHIRGHCIVQVSWGHNQERPENDDPCRRDPGRVHLLALPTSYFELVASQATHSTKSREPLPSTGFCALAPLGGG